MTNYDDADLIDEISMEVILMTIKTPFDIEDFRPYADKHRNEYVRSGPHWPLVLRYPVLFDEYERLLRVNAVQQYKLNLEIANLKRQLEIQREFVGRLSKWIDAAVEIHPDLFPVLKEPKE